MGLEVEMWILGWLLPCIASCGIPWRGAGVLLLSALGMVSHKGTLGTSEIQMVASREVLFLATLCSLLPLWGWKRKDLGSEELSASLGFTESIVHSHSFLLFSMAGLGHSDFCFPLQ